jgi:hypothetical protein
MKIEIDILNTTPLSRSGHAGLFMAEFEVSGMTFDRWLESIGRSRATGYRWIALGMVTPVNIHGKNYITREEDGRFWDRVKAGEFAQEMPTIEEKVAALRNRDR